MKPLTILIVEDETVVANDLREALETAGHRVTALARTCEEALAAVRWEVPDLALLDIHLEGPVDGINTARELLSQHPMPIVYLTSHSEPSTLRQAHDTRPAAYLPKPFHPDELVRQIELAHRNHREKQVHADNPVTAERVFLPIGKGHEGFVKADVMYLSASGSYTNLHLLGEPVPRLLTMNLGYLSQFFTTPNFYRVSRSLFLNLDHVSRLESGQVLMNNHTITVPLPDGSRAELLRKLAVIRTR